MYKAIFCVLSAAVLLVGTAAGSNAQPKIKLQPKQTVYLYPEGQTAKTGLTETQGPLESNGLSGDEEIQPNGNITNIGDKARIDLYFPKKSNGQMLIVCPGGGYAKISSYNEGLYVAEWLISKGYTACVVTYRLPNGHYNVPLRDVQNAFRYCRAHADQWKVKQIGIMGFSAGGHLAACASNLFADKVTRPDFAVLIYPVISFGPVAHIVHAGTKDNLIGRTNVWLNENLPMVKWKKNEETYLKLSKDYSMEQHVTEETPTTFLAACADDRTVLPINSIMYFEAMQLAGVPSELHIWPNGGHGWGFTKQEYQPEGKTDKFACWRNEFYNSLDNWMKNLRK